MTSKNNVWMVRLAIVGISLVGLGGTAARAAEPTELGVSATAAPAPRRAVPLTAAQAAARAREYREKAAWYRSLGGAGWKSAFARWADEEATHFAAEATRLVTPPAIPSPEAAHFSALAETYRGLGGAYYKAGIVQKAEEAARRFEPVAVAPAAPETALGRHLRYGKGIEAFLTTAR
jgi:hypothetical protein